MAAWAGWSAQQKGIVLDGCAGPGGWSEGIRRWLGLHDVGLEWDRSACETRAAAGHTTVRVDVSSFVLDPVVGRVWGLLFSPPCTKFSAAGKGFGHLVMDLLADGIRAMLRGVDRRAALREEIYPVALAEQERANAERAEERRWSRARVEAAARDDAFVTVLMLEPARFLWALMGAEDPEVPFEWAAFEQVPGVLPLWEVYAVELRRLGWSVWTGVLNAADFGVPQTRRRAILMASRVRKVVPPEPTHYDPKRGAMLWGEEWVTMAQALGLDARDVVNTRGDRKTPGGNNFSVDEPSWALTEKARSWILHTNRDQKPDGSRQTTDPHTAPAPALTSKSGGQWVLKHNARANATVRRIDEPSATLAFGHARNEYQWINTRPATTVCATDRIAPPGHRDRSPKGESQFASPDTVRITIEEAAVLQSFPADYPWQGTRTKKFEQIGNAIPTLLAAHIVSAVSGVQIQEWQVAA
ncbi:DNA cytosine methyltransferase [Streptomyces sp. NPDC048288]|uniref:DNA cytosine methyltransferase n=1 Tax=Streptomyces sp. NPDC048288 TaxID=3365529 RepID=UPI003713AF17